MKEEPSTFMLLLEIANRIGAMAIDLIVAISILASIVVVWTGNIDLAIYIILFAIMGDRVSTRALDWADRQMEKRED